MDQQENYQPKSIIFRKDDFTDFISKGMGIVDFDTFYDNEMSKDKFIIKFVNQIVIAIETGVCKVPKTYKFPIIYAERLDKIWNGVCYYGITKRPFTRKFLYDYPEENYDEIIQLPKFRNMTPVGKIADETLLLQVREAIPIKYAFEGSSYATLLSDGKMIHAMSDGMMPKFTQEDMQSLTKKSYFYTRPVFNRFMEDFEHFFNYNWNHISVSLQTILDFSDIGLNFLEPSEIEQDEIILDEVVE